MRRRPLILSALAVVLTVASSTAATPSSAAPEGAERALAGVVQVVGGNFHSCALLASGEVRCWGDNNNSQLGDGNAPNDQLRAVPVLDVDGVGNLTGITQLAAGGLHTCARRSTGQVVCWGENGAGQLGDNAAPTDADLPVVVAGVGGTGALTGVREVAAGASHTCARLGSGQARCWGDNLNGQLGDDNVPTDSDSPVPVVNATATGRLGGVAQLGAGLGHTCALVTGGQLRCWGSNSSGQLGNNAETGSDRPVTVRAVTGSAALSGVTQMAAGGAHTCARLGTARLLCWGNGTYGQLGDGTNNENRRPGQVLSPSGDALLSGVTMVTAGDSHTCVRLSTQQARCWGLGTSGAIGDGGAAERRLPRAVRNLDDSGPLKGVAVVAAGQSHSCALLAIGQVRCWGQGAGQIGDGFTLNRFIPVVVSESSSS